jgi:activator of HSP90 ATPase
MSTSIHQELVFETTPARIYELLTDAQKFSKMSGGAPAEIDPKAGGAFSCFGGMILGRNVECVPGERMVQAWRVKLWEPGVYSLVRFELRPEGTGTRVILDHAGFPDGQAEHLGKGWYANYWEPLRKVLT